MSRKKVTVVGGGFVGSTTAQRIVDLELADVVLTDILDGPPAGKALDMVESDMAAKTWAAGEEFTLADCAAAPALYYGNRFFGPFRDRISARIGKFGDKFQVPPDWSVPRGEGNPALHPGRETAPHRGGPASPPP